MSDPSLPPSEDPKSDSDDEWGEKEVVPEGQPPLAEGEEAPRREDTSTLPKATMPVELAPKPVSPAEAAAQSTEPEGSASDEGTPAEGAQPAPQPEPEPAPPSRPPGFMGWVGSLSLAEKLCCLLIVVGVLVFSLTVFVPALFDFPDEPELLDSDDFPIKGLHIEVSAADTYWRKPVLEGDQADTVRPGTLLIPVLETKLSGSGNVRILFRNNEGSVVGDPVALDLAGDQDFAAACTMGLKLSGDFAAQRTGNAELWSVDFLEAPSGASGAEDFKLLFQMKISPIQQ